MKIILLMFTLLVFPVLAHAEIIYQCTDAHHHTMYTNKEFKGFSCRPLVLPQLSLVPDHQGTSPMVSPAPLSSVFSAHESTPTQDPPLIASERQTYQIHPSVGENVALQVCDLYGKWLDLNLATRGGLYYHPLTAPLMTMFGGGYIPMECRR